MTHQNPLLDNYGLPAFDLIEPKHVVPAVEEMLKQAQAELAEVEKNASPSWDAVMSPLEGISRKMSAVWGPVTHLVGVKNSPELREAYNKVLPQLVDFSLRFAQNETLFKATKSIKEGAAWQKLDDAQKRIIEKKLLAARHQGIELEGKQRERFNEISQRLSQLATEFSNNVLDSTNDFYLVVKDKEDLAEVPQNFRDMWAQTYNSRKAETDPEATGENGPWGITLDYPSFDPAMRFSTNRELRCKLYLAYITRASEGKFDNSGKITEILKLRAELCQLLGYKTYAELSVANKMAGTVEDVDRLLEDLRESSYEPAKKELEELFKFAAEQGLEGEFKNWDFYFYSDKLKQKLYSYSEEEVRPYFPMPRVLDGLFKLVEKIFQIKVEESLDPVPVWNSDVKFYNIFDHKGHQIASFYLDPYSRPADKRGGAWMDTCIDRGFHGNQILLPVAYLVCNSTPPVGDKPSLMSFREVETLFHEFGHGLQHMLTKVNYLDAAGINGVEWDAVELPSQFMENWCYHKPTLMSLTSHVETGEQLPEELFEKIKSSKNYQSATMMARQLHFGMIDIELHHRFDPEAGDVFALNQEIAKKATPMPVIPEDRFLCSFSHIFAGGYSAGYYSYKWAEVLSADAFSKFEETGLDNEDKIQEVGLQFRDSVLALGGSRHPMDVFKDFRGRTPSVEPLLRHSGLS
ncbi:M3 family metallopeptidase [Pseudobacteriovorax antillogorgiicola]|uniref:oligopeptidase A n=1 Tax=Pseudobacteriovorax antillogorgiicola TaxID=1513793 RepID=A0A1Y6CVV4_9BACT|nr:M3 family metallopeptidase [Pseudobacteriovorax antillogorgiicola]TCS42247.1 oligopeptidase A [Pseudobacteriovorax antillogorgiicola]SMF82585.1 oligopeptidase A [Pseudobacteriovorax antillogorgiicola]